MKGINRINDVEQQNRRIDSIWRCKGLKKRGKKKYKEKETKECMKIRKSIVSKQKNPIMRYRVWKNEQTSY